MKLGLGNSLPKTKASKSAAVNPFANSPRTFVESPAQVIFDQAGTSILFASNGAGGVLKMSGTTNVYPSTSTAFFYYSWNGTAWVYVGLKTQGQNTAVTSFTHSTIDVLDAINAVYFAANYTP
jgi:hypothetical protein